MKIIQDRELARIQDMIKSNDKELRELAVVIMSKKETVRFNIITIIAANALLFLLSLTLIIFLSYRVQLGLYWIPLIILVLFHLVGIVIHLATIIDFRKKYS